MIDGQCLSIKLAGSSAYQNKSGKCYKRIAGGNPVASGSGTQSRPSGSRTGTQSHPRSYQEVEARDNTGVCNGPHTELTGGQCRDIAGGATGFMIDGQCLSIKLAGSSAYQNKSGKCYKRIAGGNPVASGSGTQNHPSGSRTGTQSHPRSYQEVEARDNTGVCNGPHTELTGGQCRDIAGGATGFMIDGQCISIKLAGSSAYQNRSGQCYKRIAGGNPVASGSGTQSRPRTQNVRARSPRKL
ncbi:hypothetical protein H0H87_004312 [Tephrocybe sp. NHM501043]|nr:hypothetical protein H0H87_004312 [Tephrocybe sp. NHM501043]